MPSIEGHPDSRRPASQAQLRAAGPGDSSLNSSLNSSMSEAQLAGRCQQLRRKLSNSDGVWHSGRLACLAEALRALEEEMQRRRSSPLQ